MINNNGRAHDAIPFKRKRLARLEVGEPVLQSPKLCWECVAHLKRSVRFKQQVQDSYRLLQPMLMLLCDKEDLSEFLQTSVCRPGRLRTCFIHSINISAQGDDTQGMTVDEDDDNKAALKYLLNTTEASTFRAENFDDQFEETYARTRSNEKVKPCVATINTPNSTDIESTRELKSTLACNYCYRRFTSKTLLERHIATCDDSVVLLCSDNQYSECSNGHRLLQHINTKTNITEKHYPKSILNKKSLILRNNSDISEKRFQCEVCYKSFAQRRNLIPHIRTHTGEKPFQCEVCHKSFASKSHLISHTRTHTGEKPFQCEVCHKSFASKSHFISHTRTHTGEKPFQCEVCHKSFAQQSTLLAHNRTHTGEKPFQCEVCYKSFAQRKDLINHIRTHTGERPFQCEVCHKSFVQKSTLIQHSRTHTGGGEKPFLCVVCLKSFSKKQILVNHIRTHSGEKPFKCQVCDKAFARKCTIKHMRTHTGEKTVQFKDAAS